MALANAGASGGRPGSPMPVGGSALGTMCTAICGMSVMRGTVKSPKLLCSHHAVLERDRRARQAHRQAHDRRALHLRFHARGLTARLQCTPAVTRCSIGWPSFTEASTT